MSFAKGSVPPCLDLLIPNTITILKALPISRSLPNRLPLYAGPQHSSETMRSTRKTRCDPTLPRCLPCERSGSVCEYYDTTRNKKINRNYVVHLQQKVRQLEAELSQYTDDDTEYPESAEDMVRPGGLVKLNESDETPRYLGPSSGIAMTRLLMEQAKRYTDSQRISELIPDVRARRLDRLTRMQSIVNMNASISGPSGMAGRKKSFPMISAHPAQSLPTRQVVDKLIEIFNSRAQYFTPTLHEKEFEKDLEDVYDGNTDPYKNFVVRMVLAISLQKLDIQYAGLADSYYLAAMQYFEDVIRPKDLKTLQCLILIGSYSLLTPTRTVVFHIIGLATRICQQLGLADEKTISAGYSMGLIDPLQMDMRRRLTWIVTGNELGLAHAMGRPNGFAKGDDFMDVQFFEAVDDEYITEDGIRPGPPSEKKLVAIHFCKMRIRQAEIRRNLYEKKRPEPRDSNSPVFIDMERKIKDWIDSAPQEPVWCKPWFTGRYHTMAISLHRPSPQIPRPSSRSASICYDSAVYIINLSNQQVKKSAVDITWVFVLTLNMSLNVLLWAVSYREVREAHPKDDVEEIINVALDVIDQCSERWPGTKNASQLYSIFGRACLQSYDTNDDPSNSSGASTFTSPLLADSASPAASENSLSTTVSNGSAFTQNQQRPLFTQPVFGYTVDSAEDMNAFSFESNPFQQPTFRSNSIFRNPSSEPTEGRRPSYGYFPPDFKHPAPGDSTHAGESKPPVGHNPHQTQSPPTGMHHDQIPTPPDSMSTTSNSFSPPMTSYSSTTGSPTPKMTYASPMPINMSQQQTVPPAHMKYESAPDNMKYEPPSTPNAQPTPQQTPQQSCHRTPTFAVPPLPQHVINGQRQLPQQQRPLPQQTNSANDWFSPAPHFMSPYSFNDMNNTNGFWNDAAASSAAFTGIMAGGGYESTSPTSMGGFGGRQGMPPGFGFGAERHGSLSVDQQVELMQILETDGVGEINNFLGMDMSGISGAPSPNGNIGWN
ncbi:Positive regulator of purine utilization [Cytospora mali]|uniref:Positive regulator of purine utilization n=1 Tax=Cytospora mali TaxID=578113 RepID=A0A194VYW3_CYTMA|nr:Positive regulator of purine utilization [Valsa mali]